MRFRARLSEEYLRPRGYEIKLLKSHPIDPVQVLRFKYQLVRSKIGLRKIAIHAGQYEINDKWDKWCQSQVPEWHSGTLLKCQHHGPTLVSALPGKFQQV